MTQSTDSELDNRRVLLIDDNPQIHADFKKILGAPATHSGEFDSAAADFFGSSAAPATAAAHPIYELASAMQGQEALEMLREARSQGRPFALAFCDVRMPPGWDGVETLEQLWAADPDLQAVICTAFSDYSYEETLARLGLTDRLLILKKPFDPIEVQQMAGALCAKWNSEVRERLRLEEVRSYAASLETVNHALRTDRAMAQAFAEGKSRLLVRSGAALEAPAAEILEACLALEDLCREQAHAVRLSAGVERIGERAARLLRMLHALVELAHSEDKAVQLQNGACDLRLLLEQALSGARTAPGGPIGALELRGRIPVRIQADSRRLGQVLGAMARFAARGARGQDTLLETMEIEERAGCARLLCVEAQVPGLALARDEVLRLFEALETQPAFVDAELSLELSLARRWAHALGGGLEYVQLSEALGALRLTFDPGEPSSASQAA